MASLSALVSHLATATRLGLMPHFVASSARNGVPLHVLLGVASRETHCGALIERTGWRGDAGHGRGVMQIDDRAHPAFVTSHRDDDHAANIEYGAAYLASLARTFGGYTKAALAAYNAGPGNVQQAVAAGRDPDSVTTGRDYGADVLSRATAFAELVRANAPAIGGGVVVVLLVASLVFTAIRRISP